MVYRMVVQNLRYRPIRTVISVLAVAIEVGMVMLVVGMSEGMLHEGAKRVQGVGADVLVQPPGASYFFGLTSAPMPIKIGDLLQQLPHVQGVAPVLFQFNSIGGVNLIYGIDMQSFDQVSGGFVYHAGGPLAGPYDLLVDDLYARANHVKVGSSISLLNHDFHVAGIVEHGKGARLFIPLQTAQDLSGAANRASIFFVKCTDPGYTGDVMESIQKLLPKYSVQSIQEYMSMVTSNNLPALTDFISVLVGVAVSIGFLVTFLSMYSTVTERTREVGILKSLGASKGYIIEVILREAAILSVIGIAAGIGGTLLAKHGINIFFPTIYVELTAAWALRAALLAFAGSILGGVYPALKAAQLDPIDALAYE